MTCRICGCTEDAGCPGPGGCSWAEPGLCTICDLFIDDLAAVIADFTALSASTEQDERFTRAVNLALSEASGRMRAHSLCADEPLIVMP